MLTLSQTLQERFRDEYARLNERQKEAVDSIEGPVMVIAGPGTGKTQILASRIAKILLETQVNPSNILCLTFTDAGVVAMRKRLTQMIGTEAYSVNIHTFHSFCNKVIQQHTREFRKMELEALSELERVQFIKQLIDGFDNDNPLKRFKGEAYYDLGNLAQLFSTMKREGWDPKTLLPVIDHYIDVTIPENFTHKKTPSKGLTQAGKSEVEKMEKTKAAVAAFDDYQAILAQNNRYDFDDMINWVIRLFETREDILLSYQEQLQYILVDEYQDTSGTQNRIVELLSSYWEDNPNLFVVGDDDQSIYRFQGANIENMLDIRNRLLRHIRTIVLSGNYRSVQPVLDAARALIAKNKKRLIHQLPGLTKDLYTANPALKDLSIPPVIRIYENEFSENVHITLSIRSLIDSGISPGRIAIIYREHKFGDELQKFLHMESVPYYVKRSLNLLEDPFIDRILNMFRYFVAEHDKPYSGEYLLFNILHYDFFKLHPLTIARISSEVYENARKKKEPATLRDFLAEVEGKQSGMLFATDEENGELARISGLLNFLQKESFNLPLQQWFEKLINEAGILAYVMRSGDKVWLMEKLSCLFDYIKEESHRNPLCHVADFLAQVDLMKENGIDLPLVQTTGNETGVNLLSCHGSKGLEFEYVFFLGTRTDVWEEKRKNNRGFRLPPAVFHGSVPEETLAEDDLEELRRLFYVTVTRAEKHLFISYPAQKNDGRELIPSRFVEEIREPLALVPEKIYLTEEEQIRFQSLRFGIVRRPVLEQAEKDYIDGLLSRFVMNVTALNNYLDCPLRFYYNNLVRVPGAKSEAASFGSAVHAALKALFDKARLKENYPPLSFFTEQFTLALMKEREVFTGQSFIRFRDHGYRVLSAYYEKHFRDQQPQTVFLTEYPLSNVALDGIPLKGITDLIRFRGNDIIITDFKTGSADKAKKRKEFARAGTDEKKPEGGNYWRQAVFYEILVRLLPKNWKVQQVEFDFVEPNPDEEFDKISVPVTREDEAIVEQQIRDTWEKIRNHDFYTGCGREDCEWCGFTRENKIYTRLLEEEEKEVI